MQIFRPISTISITGCLTAKVVCTSTQRRFFTFSIFHSAAPAFGTCQITIPKFSAASFCETVARERVSHTVLVPTMINLLTQFPDLKAFDLTSLEAVAYGGSPVSPALVRRTREVLPHVKLVQGYGLSETGF